VQYIFILIAVCESQREGDSGAHFHHLEKLRLFDALFILQMDIEYH